MEYNENEYYIISYEMNANEILPMGVYIFSHMNNLMIPMQNRCKLPSIFFPHQYALSTNLTNTLKQLLNT